MPRDVRDTLEHRPLVGRGVCLNHEVAQHRPQHDVHLGEGELGAETPPGATAERQPPGAG